MVAAVLVTFIFVLVYLLYFKFKTTYSHWRNKGVNGPTPEFLIGNIRSILKKEDSINTLCDRIYSEYPNEKLVGIYQALTPSLVIRDPSLIKEILVKGFPSFTDRGNSQTKKPISVSLFTAEGQEWHTLRKKFTPLFTTGKLKQMIPLLQTCVEQYTEYVTKKTNQSAVHEVRNLSAKYTMKAITSIGFGIDIDTFVDEQTTFEVMANKIFIPTGLRRYANIVNHIWPGFFDQFNISVWPEDITGFFLQLVEEIVRDREGKPKLRNDFMDLMIELREQGKVTRLQDGQTTELDITYELITAQAILFYAAGFETTAGSMSFLLYELALNPDIQRKCHEEIDRVMEQHKGKLDYEGLKELQYITMAFEETLRKYPVGPILFRKCVSDYKFEDLDLTVEKGTKILIPVISVQNDPKYFSNPEKFDPERFSAENRESVSEYFLTFGIGPRNCIGTRLGKVQAILGIAYFLHKFKVSPCEKTPKKITMDPNAWTLVSKEGVWLHVEQRKNNIRH